VQSEEDVKFKVLSNNSSLEVLKLLRRIGGIKQKVVGEYAESILRIHLILRKTKRQLIHQIFGQNQKPPRANISFMSSLGGTGHSQNAATQ
jgi:hypothetical protein